MIHPPLSLRSTFNELYRFRRGRRIPPYDKISQPLLLNSHPQPSTIGCPKIDGSPCRIRSQIMQRLLPSGLKIVTVGVRRPRSWARWIRNHATAMPLGEANRALPSWLSRLNVSRLDHGTLIVPRRAVKMASMRGLAMDCVGEVLKLALLLLFTLGCAVYSGGASSWRNRLAVSQQPGKHDGRSQVEGIAKGGVLHW